MENFLSLNGKIVPNANAGALMAKKYVENIPNRIGLTGYSSAPEGYEANTKKCAKALFTDANTRGGGATVITSPTAAEHSIDAIATEIDMPKVYVTSECRTKYVNLDELAPTIDKEAYGKVPKFATKMINGDKVAANKEYGKLMCKLENELAMFSGRGTAVGTDFKNAIEAGYKVAIADNMDLKAAATKVKVDKEGKSHIVVDNASKYLKDQIMAFVKGKELPHNAEDGLPKEFFELNKHKLLKNVAIFNLNSWNAESVGKNMAEFLRGAKEFNPLMKLFRKFKI